MITAVGGVFDGEAEVARELPQDGTPVEDPLVEERQVRTFEFGDRLSPVVDVDVGGVRRKVADAGRPIFVEEKKLKIGRQVRTINSAEQAQSGDRIFHQTAFVAFEAQLDAFLAGKVTVTLKLRNGGLPLRLGRLAGADHTFAPGWPGEDAKSPATERAGVTEIFVECLPAEGDFFGAVHEVEVGTELEALQAGRAQGGGPKFRAVLAEGVRPEFDAVEAIVAEASEAGLGFGVREAPAEAESDHRARSMARVRKRYKSVAKGVTRWHGAVESTMSENFDLRNWLRDWRFDPENPARIVHGDDGREVLQVRTPLGVEQYELEGRPDGVRPHNAESALDFYRERLARLDQQGKAETFALSNGECAELFDESLLYYFRYLHLFQLRRWKRVIRDTNRNLALFDFVQTHAKRESDRRHLEQWRSYLLRMNVVARAMVEWEAGRHGEALRVVRETIARIEALPDLETETFTTERDRSLEALRELVAQIEQTRPLSEVERLERELTQAVSAEKFEQAASLRDRIRVLRTRVV